MVVSRYPELEHYHQLVETARSRLAELELEYEVENSKIVSVHSRFFHSLRPCYQERDRLRLLIQYPRAGERRTEQGYRVDSNFAHDADD